MSDQPASAEELRKAQETEYGTYVATERIEIGGALAFNVGDSVPAGHVDSNDPALAHVKDSVAKRTTKAGKAALGQPDDDTTTATKAAPSGSK